MHSGASTASWAATIIARSSSASSTSGMPALMSSMSAPSATCARASATTRVRSPLRSSSAKALRPVGLIRSPMIVNGPSELIVTVLDRERTIVSTALPFGSRRDSDAFAEPRDRGVLAERDQVQAAHAGQRERVPGLLAGDLEALLVGVGRGLDARQQRVRHLDAGHVRADVAQRA